MGGRYGLKGARGYVGGVVWWSRSDLRCEGVGVGGLVVGMRPAFMKFVKSVGGTLMCS